MIIKNNYNFGDSFYFKNDPEQKEYMLIGLHIKPVGLLLELSYCGEVVDAYEVEVSSERDDLKKLKNG